MMVRWRRWLRITGIATSARAAALADWQQAPGSLLLLADQPGLGSWPITGGSSIQMDKEQTKPERARKVRKFFDWAYHNGQQMAASLGYIPIPDSLVELIEETWAREIGSTSGAAVWTSGM